MWATIGQDLFKKNFRGLSTTRAGWYADYSGMMVARNSRPQLDRLPPLKSYDLALFHCWPRGKRKSLQKKSKEFWVCKARPEVVFFVLWGLEGERHCPKHARPCARTYNVSPPPTPQNNDLANMTGQTAAYCVRIRSPVFAETPQNTQQDIFKLSNRRTDRKSCNPPLSLSERRYEIPLLKVEKDVLECHLIARLRNVS